MWHKTFKQIKRRLGFTVDPNRASSEDIERFKANSKNSFLVSFPRTGSHWLRMIMELYFGRPSLIRSFYYTEKNDYLTLHTHDLSLDVIRSHVIYLYREPVSTIYSQLQYHKESIDDKERIMYWADLYGRHLDKWLYQEQFTQKKTIVRYELLKENMSSEFWKVCSHFNLKLDEATLEKAMTMVSKSQVQQKTRHDPQVINTTQTYIQKRHQFYEEYGQLVWDTIFINRQHLQQSFFKI